VVSKRVTISDLARECQVSTFTVSMALRDREGVAAATRQRVREAARRLDFRPSFAARSLSRGKTDLVGLLLPEVVERFFAVLVELFGTMLPQRGYNMLLELIRDPVRTANFRGLDLIREGRVDGLLLWPKAFLPTEWARINEIAREHPVVAVGRDVGPDVDSVEIDRVGGYAMAAQHLASLGHRKIGFVSFSPPPDDLALLGPRELGYVQGLQKSGLSYDRRYHYCLPHTSEAGGYMLARELIDQSNRPTALIIPSTSPALGVIRRLHEAGMRVPQDVALIGYGLDEQPDAVYAEVPLTVVGVPRDRFARYAVDLLTYRMQERESSKKRSPRQKIVIEPQLVIRKSSGGPAATGAESH
jgi:LacI family transcriptional regulator